MPFGALLFLHLLFKGVDQPEIILFCKGNSPFEGGSVFYGVGFAESTD